MGTGYVPAGEDRPAPGASMAEDTIDLQLLTAGERTGPLDTGTATDHHNF